MAFENIVSQHPAINALRSIINNKQARGSYMFLGPDGVGKCTAAIEFAKAVNCESGECGSRCVSCKKIDSKNHPDVFLIRDEDGAGSIKIERIRSIIYEASLKPYEGKKRVFIIENAEAMTEEAQNALLKLLEEPPKDHILILTASNAGGFLPTVISRCRVLRFNSLRRNEIESFLHESGTDETKALLFSHMAMGSMGRALDFKEKDIIAQREKIVNEFFLRKSALFRETVLNEYVSGDLEGSLHMLLCWYRDILIAKFTHEPNTLFNIDRYDDILSYSGRFSEDKLKNDISLIMDTIEQIRGNVNPKIALFNMAAGLIGDSYYA